MSTNKKIREVPLFYVSHHRSLLRIFSINWSIKKQDKYNESSAEWLEILQEAGGIVPSVQDNFIKRLLPGGGALPRSQRMSAASWGLSRRVQARRHCSINNTQPNRSQHIPFISSTHFILPPCPPPTDKRGKQGSTTRMKKTPCPFSLRKNPSPSSANLFFSP